MYNNLKMVQISKLMEEVVEEIKDAVKVETTFLKDFELIDHLPQVNSFEIHTVYSPCGNHDIGMTNYVSSVADLIPSHIKRIKDSIQDCKRIYIRVMPEISIDGIKIGIYTRLITIT